MFAHKKKNVTSCKVNRIYRLPDSEKIRIRLDFHFDLVCKVSVHDNDEYEKTHTEICKDCSIKF